jgi:hypothetical protein
MKRKEDIKRMIIRSGSVSWKTKIAGNAKESKSPAFK